MSVDDPTNQVAPKPAEPAVGRFAVAVCKRVALEMSEPNHPHAQLAQHGQKSRVVAEDLGTLDCDHEAEVAVGEDPVQFHFVVDDCHVCVLLGGPHEGSDLFEAAAQPSVADVVPPHVQRANLHIHATSTESVEPVCGEGVVLIPTHDEFVH